MVISLNVIVIQFLPVKIVPVNLMVTVRFWRLGIYRQEL